MGENAKAITVFMAMMTELPDNVKIVLTDWIQQWQWFQHRPEMVQAAIVYIAVKFPVAAAVAWLTWWVKNHPPSPVFGTLERPMERPQSLSVTGATVLILFALATPAFAQIQSDGETVTIYNREVFMGIKPNWTGAGTDFYLDPGDSLQVRKIVASDMGNPGQLFLRRAGPDNADPYTNFPPTRLPLGTNIGHISWAAYEGVNVGWGERSAMLYVRYQGPAKGSMHFQTSGVDRLIIETDGTLNLYGVPQDGNRIKVRRADGTIGYIRIENEGGNRFLPWNWF